MEAIWTIPVVIGALLVAGIFGALAHQLNGELRADYTASSAEYNASIEAGEGMTAVTSKLDTVGTVAVISIVIALLFGAVFFFRNKQ